MGTAAARYRKKRTKRGRVAVLVLVAGLFHAAAGGAQETFLGVSVEPAAGSYLGVKPVTGRAGPRPTAKRPGPLRKGDGGRGGGRKGRRWRADR